MTLSATEIDELMYSDEYAEYIMEHCQGDRVICNGHTLLDAMEDGYLFKDFLESKGIDADVF